MINVASGDSASVGRGRTVKMQSLRQVFESLRVSRVARFIASGNVIFEATTPFWTRIGQGAPLLFRFKTVPPVFGEAGDGARDLDQGEDQGASLRVEDVVVVFDDLLRHLEDPYEPRLIRIRSRCDRVARVGDGLIVHTIPFANR